MTNVYLDPPVLKALKELSASTRVPASAYIREGVEMILAKYSPKAKSKRGKA